MRLSSLFVSSSLKKAQGATIDLRTSMLADGKDPAISLLRGTHAYHCAICRLDNETIFRLALKTSKIRFKMVPMSPMTNSEFVCNTC